MHPAVLAGTKEDLLSAGKRSIDAGDYPAALKEFSELIKIDPEFGDAYYLRGTVYANFGEYDLAIKDLSEAIRRDPKNPLAYRNRGSSYFAKGEIAQALQRLGRGDSAGRQGPVCASRAKLRVSRKGRHGRRDG